MGGIPGIVRFGVGAAAVGAVGSVALAITSQRDKDETAARAARNEGIEPLKQERPSDSISANLDGAARVAMAGAAAAGIAGAGVALLAKQPGVAMPMLGASLGLAGTALLAGTGPLKDRVADNVGSAGRFLSSQLHQRMLPDRPDFATQLPTVDAPSAAKAPVKKPTEQQILDAKIEHMPGTPDMEEARKQAQIVIDKIQWDERDILLWMPGTYTHNMYANWFTEGVERFGDNGSVVFLDYPATLDFRTSVSTGMEALRLVLAEVAKRGGDHRVLLGGHSQGAWVIGDSLATPEIDAMVDRAALFGNPGLAAVDYADRKNPKVVELNQKNDPIAGDVVNREGFMNTLKQLEAGVTPQSLPSATVSSLQNPKASAFWLASAADPDRWAYSDPHTYYYSFTDALSWLDTGKVEAKS